MRDHYEMVVDRSAGLKIGQEVPLGTHGHNSTVVGLTRDNGHRSGDPVGLHHSCATRKSCSSSLRRRPQRREVRARRRD